MRKTAIFLSRRWDSNPRPVVYETVVGRASGYHNVHLFALSFRKVPMSASEAHLSAVKTAVRNGARWPRLPQSRHASMKCRLRTTTSLAHLWQGRRTAIRADPSRTSPKGADLHIDASAGPAARRIPGCERTISC